MAAVADLLVAICGGSGSCRLQEREKLSSFELKLSWRRLLSESAQSEVE